MEESIRVRVIAYPDRKHLVLRWIDPETGKQKSKSARTHLRREAERLGAKLEAELQEGRYKKPSKMTWEEFREYYSENALSGMKQTTAESYETTLNVFQTLATPQRLADVTTQRVTLFATSIRKLGRAGATEAHHLRHLKAVLRWAKRKGC